MDCISQVVSRHNTVERDAPPDRMIVVARGKEDVSYLSIFLPDIPHTVYQVKNATTNALAGSIGSDRMTCTWVVNCRSRVLIGVHMMLQGGWRPENALLDRGIEPAFKAAPQAKETNVYLQYIVDHYDRLPKSIAFIHAHRCVLALGCVNCKCGGGERPSVAINLQSPFEGTLKWRLPRWRLPQPLTPLNC